jgi:hypothetical protein
MPVLGEILKLYEGLVIDPIGARTFPRILAEIVPPATTFPSIPTPPAITNAPVEVDVDVVFANIVAFPPKVTFVN